MALETMFKDAKKKYAEEMEIKMAVEKAAYYEKIGAEE